MRTEAARLSLAGRPHPMVIARPGALAGGEPGQVMRKMKAASLPTLVTMALRLGVRAAEVV